jgi:hypothetical protein
MSKKSSRFNPFKKPAAQAKQPRALTEIQAEYGQLVNQAGQLQYQIHVLQKDLDAANQALVVINHEAADRIKLDKEASEAEAAKPTESKE